MKTQLQSTSYSAAKGFSAQSGYVKYNGLVKEKFLKKIRNSLFGLFDFMAIDVPRFSILQTVISFWRLVQFFGPSFCIMYKKFWVEGSVLNLSSDLISILFHLFPGFVREQIATYFLYIYAAIFILFFIIIIASAFYCEKNAKLPKLVSTSIYIFISTFGYLLHPIGAMFGGEILSAMISNPAKHFTVINLIAFTFSLLIFLIYLVIYSTGYAISVTFKSDSLTTVLPINSILLMIITIGVTIIPETASKLPLIPQVVLTFVTVLLYFGSIKLAFLNGGFVKQLYTRIYCSTAISSGIFMIIIAIHEIMGKTASEIILVLIVAIWVICYFLANYIFRFVTYKRLHALDEIEENIEKFEELKSFYEFSNIIVTGFQNAHPVCLNFSIFRSGIERWPNKLDVWLLFAKFIAIYPEENQQLSYIQLNMISNRIHGSYARYTLQQIEAIIRQREINLIPELKSKIDAIGKHVISCKAKIRYIWDLVLQGNTSELESIISNAHNSIARTSTEFNHLINKFPNNRFVARAYARFVRDVVADHELHQIWRQKCTLLQRGLSVVPDIANELGILAYPNLPKNLESLTLAASNANNATEDTLTQEIEGDDETVAIDQELKLSIKESIKSLVIPSYKNTRVLHILTILILFIAPIIAISLCTPIFIDEITKSLHYLYTVSNIRVLLFQGLGAMMHYINENIEWYYPPDDPNFPNMKLFPYPKYEDYFPPLLFEEETIGPGWGSTFDSKKQIKHIQLEFSDIILDLQPLKTYKIGNKALDTVRRKLFDKTIDFVYVHDSIYLDCWHDMTTDGSCFETEKTLEKFSITDLIVTYTTIYEDLTILKKVPWDSYNKHYCATALTNLETASAVITENVNLMLNYFISLNDEIQTITQYAMIIIAIVVTLWLIFICVFTLKTMNRDKLTIYKCLITLQKSTVFKVAEQFRVLRKEEDEENKSMHSKDEELSKQEENLLKNFTTSTDSGRRNGTDQMATVISIIFFIGSHIGLTVYMTSFYSNSGEQLNRLAPHVEHVMASYSFDLGSVILLHLLPGSVYPSRNFNILGFYTDTLLSTIIEWQNIGLEHFYMLKYGDLDNNAPSFAALGINTAVNTKIPEYCNLTKQPFNRHHVYDCLAPEQVMSYSQMLVTRLVNVYQSTTEHIIFPGDDVDLTNIWHMHQVHIFDQYYYPLFTTMIERVIKTLHDDVPNTSIIGFSLIAAVVFIEILYLIVLAQSESAQKYALSLLLQCPGKVVIANNHIMSVLSGNFKLKFGDTTTRDVDFYNNIVDELPDSIIILKQDATIIFANKATKRTYKYDTEELIGQKIDIIGSMFIDENPFKGMSDGIPYNVGDKNKKGFEKKLTFKTNNNEETHIDMQFVIMQDGIFVASRDVTQDYTYDKLIHDEKAKSDVLLSSILPAKLVSRVAAGEKNISFAVQSVSIVFMDIVSFTPWCGSLPAAVVMKTLNTLFREYDKLTARHLTMTKIKCIGDCYMAAGGIFADVNQPAAHAKDVVEFGLESIDAILKIDEEINQNLKIRVGINTGGPVVAGVLGMEKPTFEILGPTINLAQQMEHHGIPMKVHISRSVYELIYGGTFNVKERGQIELKNGSAITYVVEK